MKDDLSELHDCEKCHGKIVFIEVDYVGNTFCGYCHARVGYNKWFEERYKHEDCADGCRRDERPL